MIKLKDILSEAYAWERQEGKPLPTLAEVQAAYQAKLREDAHNEDLDEKDHEYEPEPSIDDEDDDDGDYYMDEAAKPDFLDLDDDGNETESMKSAAKDDSIDEYGGQDSDGIHADGPKNANSDVREKEQMIESFNKRMLGNLHGHEYILREAFKRK
jgi:hypothetical protein